ncbi:MULTISPECIES: threonine/serine exporter family protein [Sinobaca]|uniref:Uncharacterized membrane protein YjjB (DUF3815 family) n=1 Tax=Sinobaca qinghaiensis TaxID=342944 RepID=A0A419VU94_9BACL|nr:threonine/serine exporter family protein [Sinobaca sp. H24]RKD84147.1 uncharacterized membrane protein YjjB (DUF3815 family) [Sinobaca qinghaiensis]
MIVMEWLICFIATVAFGVIFNIPLRLLWWGGAAGVAAWIVYSTLPELGMSPVFAAAAAAFVAAFAAHWLAIWKKVPVTMFTIPGIIPLVPGGRAYSTMLAFVEENHIRGLEQGVQTFMQAGAIAAGLVFALSLFSIGKGVGQRYETEN